MSERMRMVLAWLASMVGPKEVCLLSGLALLSWGCALIWSPAGFVVPGSILVWMALPPRPPKQVIVRSRRRA